MLPGGLALGFALSLAERRLSWRIGFAWLGRKVASEPELDC